MTPKIQKPIIAASCNGQNMEIRMYSIKKTIIGLTALNGIRALVIVLSACSVVKAANSPFQLNLTPSLSSVQPALNYRVTNRFVAQINGYEVKTQ